MAAVLHEVVEDTEYSLRRLAASGCPQEVLAALDCLTRRKGESYEQFIERLVPNEVARRVKRAGLEDNILPAGDGLSSRELVLAAQSSRELKEAVTIEAVDPSATGVSGFSP
jgi:predicted metal-dependent TIM-barrel fold hydrolase